MQAGDVGRVPFSAREAWTATWAAKWELLVPVVALVSLFAGFATPVEAAAITALYTFFINVVVQRDLHIFRDVPASTVQYHPEAGPGPHDALHLFDRFLDRLVAA